MEAPISKKGKWLLDNVPQKLSEAIYKARKTRTEPIVYLNQEEWDEWEISKGHLKSYGTTLEECMCCITQKINDH